jgi:hypothetical protein
VFQTRFSKPTLLLIAAGAAALPASVAGQPVTTYADRREVIAALENLIATGEPRHVTHDDGERLQMAVDDAVARGDRDIELLAIRAASPLIATMSRPVASSDSLPHITLDASAVLRVTHAVPYGALLFASVDGAEAIPLGELRSGEQASRRVDSLSRSAAQPGFHVVNITAELTFDAPLQGTPSWAERRTLRPLVYAVYDPVANSSAAIRALVSGPHSMPAREFDSQLGGEPFAVWLNAVLSVRSADHVFVWQSHYCDDLTGEAGLEPRPTAVCAVVYFQAEGNIGQIWFRTAEIGDRGRGVEWIAATPPRFEGLVINDSIREYRSLVALPVLLDTPEEIRPVGDPTIQPDDIIVTPADPQPGAIADVAVTVRNTGHVDLYKVFVAVNIATDLAGHSASRHFVVDVPAQGAAAIRMRVVFPAGYGFVEASAMQLTDHSPFESRPSDPTPYDACAVRIVNGRLAPSRSVEAAALAGGCIAR